MTKLSRRAKPLPPDERRAALIASTLPLVLEHGPGLSTRQIAQAAGVAEGTIFRAFNSKDELVNAAVASAFDATPALEELRRIDRSAPLRTRLVRATEVLARRFERVFRLMDAFAQGTLKLDPEARAAAAVQRSHLLQALAELIEPDRDRVRCSPTEAARRLWMLSLAGSHPRLGGDEPLSPDETVSMLLDGIARRSPPSGDPAC